MNACLTFAVGAITGIIATYLLIGYSLSLSSPYFMEEMFMNGPLFTIAHLFNYMGGV